MRFLSADRNQNERDTTTLIEVAVCAAFSQRKQQSRSFSGNGFGIKENCATFADVNRPIYSRAGQ
jgi:hypothetical protein